MSGQREEMIVARCGGEIDLVDTWELGFPIGLENDISDFIHEKRIQLKPGEGTGRGGDLVLSRLQDIAPQRKGEVLQ